MYKLTKENKNKEEEIIAQILENNEYPLKSRTKTRRNHPQIAQYKKTNVSPSHTLAPALE
jgi:hypothetical protein